MEPPPLSADSSSSAVAATTATAATAAATAATAKKTKGGNNKHPIHHDTDTIAVDPVGPRKKKKKDRTSTALNSATVTNAAVTNNTGKGNHPMMRNQLLPKGLSNKSDNSTKGTTTDGSLPADGSMTYVTAHAQRHAKDTTTAVGRMMYEMLNTFSTNESMRFQSYQRSSFSSSVIENYIAACIEHRYHRKHSNSNNTNINESSAAGTVPPQPPPPPPTRLEDYVSTPEQASDIGLIVATAAKIYAQRLIVEAAHLQRQDILAQQQQQRKTANATTSADHGSNNNNNKSNDSTATPMDVSSPTRNDETATHPGTSRVAAAAAATTTANPVRIHPQVLLCPYVYQAVQDRQRRRVDPGFFVVSSPSARPSSSSMEDNLPHTTFNLLYDQRRLAAMAAATTPPGSDES